MGHRGRISVRERQGQAEDSPAGSPEGQSLRGERGGAGEGPAQGSGGLGDRRASGGHMD